MQANTDGGEVMLEYMGTLHEPDPGYLDAVEKLLAHGYILTLERISGSYVDVKVYVDHQHRNYGKVTKESQRMSKWIER